MLQFGCDGWWGQMEPEKKNPSEFCCCFNICITYYHSRIWHVTCSDVTRAVGLSLRGPSPGSQKATDGSSDLPPQPPSLISPPRAPHPLQPVTLLPVPEPYINYPSSLRTRLKIGCPWLSLWHLPPQPWGCVDPSQAPRHGNHVTEVINGHSPSATWHVAPAVSLLLRLYESRAGRVPVAGWPIRHCQRPHGDEWFRETRRGWRGEVWAGRVLGVCSGRLCMCWRTNDELTRNPDCGRVVNRSIRG